MRCFASIGTGRVLATAFESLAVAAGADAAPAGRVLEDILAALVCMTPLDEEATRTLGLPSSLGSLVTTAENGTLAGRLNAVLAIKEVVSCDGAFTEWMAHVFRYCGELIKRIGVLLDRASV
ncbi:unnamed protein product [Miscanthus lutarioriparius]|uniref:Uncharacterized protein n=1 Tax=Miscanthus lutarioriparius TaxID=422564 RepID=A0A811MF86_9POAL|nr:unnamed protein product [Miscanthus lutarioriparius]